MWKGSVASFVLNGAEQVARLCDELHDGTYRPRPVSRFTVTSPKRREIVGISFRDRVYQRSLNDNVVYPLMSRSWIYDNYACQDDKGTDFGRRRFECFLQRFYREHGTEGWVLSIDVKGYYPNMRHETAEACFREKLPPWAYQMVEDILRTQYPGKVGYKPGSQVVQIAGVSLLSKIDHHAKEFLHARHYGRYMDDFRIIHHDRGYLRWCLREIASKLADLGYELNESKTRIRRVTDQNPFLGFDFRLTGKGKVVTTVDPEWPKRSRRTLGRLLALEGRGLRPEGTADASYEGKAAHVAKGDSRLLPERMERWYEDRKENA